MAKSTNPVVKVLALGIAIFVAYQIFIKESPVAEKKTKKANDKVEVVANPVTDVETQEALIVMSEQMNTVQNKNQNDMDSLLSSIEQLKTTVNQQTLTAVDKDKLVSKTNETIEQLQAEIEQLKTNVTNTSNTDNDDYLTKYDLDYGDKNVNDPLVKRKLDKDGFVIYEPVTSGSQVARYSEDAEGEGGFFQSSFDGLNNLSGYGGEKVDEVGGNVGAYVDQITNDTVLETNLGASSTLIPFITIPQSTEIFGGVAINAILGRVPRGGGVVEPYDFKISLSGENMTANGFVVPRLAKTIWRGVAIGDPALNCVRGNIYSVSFVFDDGTIGHVHDGKGKVYEGNEAIATIRDNRGNCIAGQLYGNEGSYIAAQAAADGVQAAGNAYSQAQYDSIGAGDDITQSLTGDIGKSVAGSVLGGIGSNLSNSVAERYASVYNVIAVPPGTTINIDVSRQIAIDYDTKARKVSYEFQNNNAFNTLD